MIWLVWNRISPLISRMMAPETASDSAGISRKMLANMAITTTSMPANRKPPMKEKSLREVRA